MLKLLFVIPLLVLTACSSPSERASSDIRYSKDHRTGLCFASIYVGNGGSYTNVPCTPEVKALIQ